MISYCCWWNPMKLKTLNNMYKHELLPPTFGASILIKKIEENCWASLSTLKIYSNISNKTPLTLMMFMDICNFGMMMVYDDDDHNLN
jgi:hypothetical protein